MVYCLKVEKKLAENVRKKLVKRNLLSPKWKIKVDENYIYFPLERYVEGAIDLDMEPRKIKESPYSMISKKLRREGVASINVPDYWEKIGDVIILPPFNADLRIKKKVGEIFADVLGGKTTCINHGVWGELRKPKVEIIYGESTETVHRENGINYKLDVAKIMFSSGNVDERIRMSKINVRNETIVDLFAGIGYFTLPLAIYGKPRRIYACEKNPDSYYYLLENLKINKVNIVTPLFGDNRRVCPREVADRVIMGYIRSKEFIEFAIKCLKKDGGVIHYHDTFKKEEIKHLPEKNIKDFAVKHGFSVEILKKKIVKSYAPRIYHVVVDAKLEKY